MADASTGSVTSDVLLSRPPECWDPTTPPAYDDAEGTWHVYSYADVLRVVKGEACYSYELGFTGDHPNHDVMWGFDDPRHHDLRAIVSEPFRHGVLARLTATIRTISDEIIDEIVADSTGHFEMRSAFGDPYVIQVICRVLGIELEDAARVQAWVREAAVAPLGDLPPQHDMRAYLSGLLDKSQLERRGGLVDDLIAAHLGGHTVAGEPLSRRDLIGYVWGFLAAGSDTTATSLANLMLFLSAYGVLDEVRDDPELRSSAIEESLRWYPSFPTVVARTREELRLGDAKVAAGDFVTGWITSANRDQARFRDPEVFDVRRSPNPHLAFGWGGRYCLGAPLARLEIRIAADAMLERLPALRWERELPFERVHGLVDRVEEAHFAFDASRAE